MFTDDDLLPISALQHLVFCKRQCMLIHLESAWEENQRTAEGRALHERAHREATRLESGKLIARGLRLASYQLGLSGMADVVEFIPITPVVPRATDISPAPSGARLPHRSGQWIPLPVEYKRGRPKPHDADRVQVCAQALCLEEMLGTTIWAGALYYGQPHRRTDVSFDPALRTRTAELAASLHELIATGVTPPPEFGRKCQHCSLLSLCVPNRPASVSNYLSRMLKSCSSEKADP